MDKIFAKFTELQNSVNEFLQSSKETYLLVQKAVNFLENILNWIPLSLIAVMLLTFLVFRMLESIYSKSKLLNFLLASLVVAGFWILSNLHFYQTPNWAALIKTYAMLWGAVFFLYVMQRVLHAGFRGMLRIFKSTPTANSNFLWQLDEKVFAVKREFKNANAEKFRQAVHNLDEFLKKNF